MKQFLLFTVMLLVYSGKTICQDQSDSVQLIEKLIRPKKDTSTLVYADRIDNYFIERFHKALSKKKVRGHSWTKHGKSYVRLTKSEREQILTQLDKFKKPYWKENLFQNSKLISEDTLQQILQDSTGHGRQYLYTHYGRMHSQFTNPIFFRNNRMFIIQFAVFWTSDCGQDALMIYERRNQQWQRKLYIAGGYY